MAWYWRLVFTTIGVLIGLWLWALIASHVTIH